VNNAAPQRGVPQEGAQPISVAIDPVALITTECITITSAMRKHTRWAHSSVSAILGSGLVTPISPLQATREKVIANGTSTKREQDARLSKGEYLGESNLANRWGLRGKKGKSIQDNPLMAGFGRLRRELVGCKGSWRRSVLNEEERR
jgi:brefeldin A-resistance guanine nucleotide exchange factor 1